MQKSTPKNTGRENCSARDAGADEIGISVIQFAKAMGLSRTFVYSLIANGTIKTIKLGDRRIIPATEIHRLLNNAA